MPCLAIFLVHHPLEETRDSQAGPPKQSSLPHIPCCKVNKDNDLLTSLFLGSAVYPWASGADNFM